MTALGLHALQHRGQEAVGIVSYDGHEFYARRGIGHVAQVFATNDSFAELPGSMASGHVRYSTTGGSGLRNIQPLFADLAAGGFSIAHNGNISNAMSLKRELVGAPDDALFVEMKNFRRGLFEQPPDFVFTQPEPGERRRKKDIQEPGHRSRGTVGLISQRVFSAQRVM